MARQLPDNSIQLSSGKIIYADTPILGQDLAEVMALLAPPQHFVAFTGRGGSGGGSGGPGGGGGGGGSGARGFQGPQGNQGSTGSGPQGAQGIQGFQGTNPGVQGPQGPEVFEAGRLASGTYTGDGNASQLISTGLTVPIKMLWIHIIGAGALPSPTIIFKPASVAGQPTAFLQATSQTDFSEEDLVDFTGNDFTAYLGSGGVSANFNTQEYHWVAIG